jgi:hypothetical protein
MGKIHFEVITIININESMYPKLLNTEIQIDPDTIIEGEFNNHCH